MTETLNLDQFRTALKSGGLRSVAVRATGGSLVVTAQPRSGAQVVLAKTHGGKHRGFRDPGKAIAILHEIGARKVEVDTLRIDAQIDHQTDLLSDSPRVGRIGREPGTREMVINRSPFILVYRISRSKIEIMRPLHGRPPERGSQANAKSLEEDD